MKSVSGDIYKTVKSTFNLSNYGEVIIFNPSTLIFQCRRNIESQKRYNNRYLRCLYITENFVQSVEGI